MPGSLTGADAAARDRVRTDTYKSAIRNVRLPVSGWNTAAWRRNWNNGGLSGWAPRRPWLKCMAVLDPRGEETSGLRAEVQRARWLGLVGVAERVNHLGGSPNQAAEPGSSWNRRWRAEAL